MNDTTMTHASGCSRPAPWRDRFKPGWVRLKCPECKYVGNVPTQVEPITPKPAPTSNYRCRIHHDIEVSWRGTGCPICTRKTKRRMAPEPSDDTTERSYR